MQRFIITILFSFYFFGLLEARFFQENVYRVIISCPNKPTISQSGFASKIDNTEGIFTALHGIAICGHSAKISVNNGVTKSASLSHADIQNDIAVLQTSSFKGFLTPKTQNKNLKDLRVEGYPRGFTIKLGRNVQIINPPIYERLDKLGVISINTLNNVRKSPIGNSTVLLLSGPIMIGDSGSPILSNNEVIAVVNGGLNKGQYSISWAIPISKINLKPIDIHNDEIIRLSKLKRYDLQAFSNRENSQNDFALKSGAPCSLTDSECWSIWFELAEQSINNLTYKDYCLTINSLYLEETNTYIQQNCQESLRKGKIKGSAMEQINSLNNFCSELGFSKVQCDLGTRKWFTIHSRLAQAKGLVRAWTRKSWCQEKGFTTPECENAIAYQMICLNVFDELMSNPLLDFDWIKGDEVINKLSCSDINGKGSFKW